MVFLDETKCHICKRIFCCSKCRQKHLFEVHAIAVTQLVPTSDAEMNQPAATTTIYVFCPICEQRPLVLRQQEIYAELLAHIESMHLPLRCNKCQRFYTRIEDLQEFSKCLDVTQSCSISSEQSCDTDASKVTIKKAVATCTMSTQTSPVIAQNKAFNETPGHATTPMSLINMQWKAKKEEYISDSMSSIRNLSSINNSSLRRSIGQQSIAPPGAVEHGKLIRSTSTPVQVEMMLAKPKEPPTFNASAGGGHLSTIIHSGYVDAEHNTPACSNPVPPQQRAWKVSARAKMSAVTPLRHVMSKSIQKAFVEHGGLPVPPATATGILQRRVRLDLSENSCSEVPVANLPIDLRLSPAMRRSQSESSCSDYSQERVLMSQVQQHQQHQILLSNQKLTTESIIIMRTKMQSSCNNAENSTSQEEAMGNATVYNSCESLEIIRATSELSSAAVNLQQCHGVPPITPITRIPGAIINKKLIKFDTPSKKEITGAEIKPSTPAIQDRETFYTPNAATPDRGGDRRRQPIVPRSLSVQFSDEKTFLQRPRARPPLRVCRQHDTFSCVQDINNENSDKTEIDGDEVFQPSGASTQKEKKTPQEGAGRLWSLMSTVMRLPSTLRGDPAANNAEKENRASGSLIQRCASFAGSLVRSKQDENDMQSLKRKRTQTLDSQYANAYQRVHDGISPSSSSKRFRIQGRKPIGGRVRVHT